MALAVVIDRDICLATPLKHEWVILSAPNTGDTFTTRLVSPKFVMVSPNTTSGTIPSPSAKIIPGTKTIEIGTWDGVTDLTVLVAGS